MSLLDIHETGIEKIVALHGTTISLVTPDNTVYENIPCIFNAVAHGIKLDMTEDPIGAKTNIYIQAKALFDRGINIDSDGWKVIGKRGKYSNQETFLADAPRDDFQLPGVLLFLSVISSTSYEWSDNL